MSLLVLLVCCRELLAHQRLQCSPLSLSDSSAQHGVLIRGALNAVALAVACASLLCVRTVPFVSASRLAPTSFGSSRVLPPFPFSILLVSLTDAVNTGRIIVAASLAASLAAPLLVRPSLTVEED